MDPFTYIPPTTITQPRYDAIRAAETIADQIIAGVVTGPAAATPEQRQSIYEAIGDVTRKMHDLISDACPRSADTAAAQRCVRIARMAANEAVTAGGDAAKSCLRQCLDNLRAARWQACAAIALCPESDLPPWRPTP